MQNYQQSLRQKQKKKNHSKNKEEQEELIKNQQIRIHEFVNQTDKKLNQPNYKQKQTKNISSDHYGIKNYKPATERATQQQNYYRSLYFNNIEYKDPEQIDVFRQDYSQFSGRKFVFGDKTQQERVSKALIKNSLMDYSSYNNDTFFNQKFRDLDKTQDIKLKTNSIKTQQNIDSKILQESNIEIKKQNFRKLQDKKLYNPIIISDPWNTILNSSTSLRTYDQDNILNQQPSYYNFSQNKILDDSYKSSLIKTKSIDHILPFNHSMNKYSIPIRNSFQKQSSKIYKNSIKNALIGIDKLDDSQETINRIVKTIQKPKQQQIEQINIIDQYFQDL